MSEATCFVLDESGSVPGSQPALSFVVRVWLENLGDGRTEWRGRVQDVVSGEVVYFRRWGGLVQVILELVGKSNVRSRESSGNTLPTN